MQPAVPPGLTLSAPDSSRTFIRSSLFTEELLRLTYFRRSFCQRRFSSPSGVHSDLWCILQSHRLQLSVMSGLERTCSPSSVSCIISRLFVFCQHIFLYFLYKSTNERGSCSAFDSSAIQNTHPRKWVTHFSMCPLLWV